MGMAILLQDLLPKLKAFTSCQSFTILKILNFSLALKGVNWLWREKAAFLEGVGEWQKLRPWPSRPETIVGTWFGLHQASTDIGAAEQHNSWLVASFTFALRPLVNVLQLCGMIIQTSLKKREIYKHFIGLKERFFSSGRLSPWKQSKPDISLSVLGTLRGILVFCPVLGDKKRTKPFSTNLVVEASLKPQWHKIFM